MRSRIRNIWGAAGLPLRGRLGLILLGAALKAGRLVGRSTLPSGHVRVPLGRGLQVLLAGPSLGIDYLTLLDVAVDRSFEVDPRGAVVLDAGGHRGYFGALVLREGAAAVHSLEPATDNRRTLEGTAARARRRGYRWTVEACAVGVDAGEADLHLSGESWSHSLHEPASGGIVGTERVPVRRLGDILDGLRTAYPGRRLVVKLNIERAAGEVILATPADQWAGVSDVLFDYEPGTAEPLASVLDHLADAGYALAGDNGRCFRLSAS